MKIKYFAQISEWTGCTQEDFSHEEDPGMQISVRRVLAGLASRHGSIFQERIYNPASGNLQEDVFILLNGCHLARLQGLDTLAADQDVVAVIPVTEAG